MTVHGRMTCPGLAGAVRDWRADDPVEWFASALDAVVWALNRNAAGFGGTYLLVTIDAELPGGTWRTLCRLPLVGGWTVTDLADRVEFAVGEHFAGLARGGRS